MSWNTPTTGETETTREPQTSSGQLTSLGPKATLIREETWILGYLHKLLNAH